MLIAFSGIDCAGKSTQIKLLQQYFASHGKSCTVLWYRPGYSDSMQKCKKMLKKTIVWASRRIVCHSDNQGEKNKNFGGKTQNHEKKLPPPALWLPTAFVDTALEWGVRLRILLKKYDIVICDRYFEDAKLDIQFKYQDCSWSEPLFAPIENILPKPDVSLMLWLPFDVMLERAKNKFEPFPDPPDVRRMRYRAYEFIADDNDDLKIIHADGTIGETHQKIIDVIQSATRTNNP